MIIKLILLLIAAWLCIVCIRGTKHSYSNYQYHNNWLRKQMGVETSGAGRQLFGWCVGLVATLLLFLFLFCLIINK